MPGRFHGQRVNKQDRLYKTNISGGKGTASLAGTLVALGLVSGTDILGLIGLPGGMGDKAAT